MMPTDGYVTRDQAAELTGLSEATIKRRQKAGRYPNARPRPKDPYHTWEIPVTDLVAAGDYDGPAGPEVHRVLADRDLKRQLEQALSNLDQAETRLAGREQQLRQALDEVRFLRSVVADTRTRGAA